MAVTLTIYQAVLTPALYAITLIISCATRRRRGNFLPVLAFDLAFSYLWLTAFILLALDFNHISCRVVLWNGETVCSRKYAAEAFSFIAFIVTLASFLVEFAFMYSVKGETHAGEIREVGDNDDLGALSRNLRNFVNKPSNGRERLGIHLYALDLNVELARREAYINYRFWFTYTSTNNLDVSTDL
ncbi:hypothetical protein BDV36DRAFT_290861 [Aspergillus pseudocaelatus]|uniref:MARVEL domain-containing protein n=1 Tax=Aspergillus pseudocaelatus TaxID=1825620 RepID=A0ABQ6X142_9EURO|nr:hypothetical protein BDV36DRAFT_290861 [Aspergillus pseudocaelatus]